VLLSVPFNLKNHYGQDKANTGFMRSFNIL